MSSSPAPCAACGQPSTASCTQCRVERYCGRECQQGAWKAHKKVCFPPRAVMPTCTGCGGWGVGLLQADGKCVACGGVGAPGEAK